MPVEIGNKLYFTVAERLKEADAREQPRKGIARIVTDVQEVGGMVVVMATVCFEDGFVSTGHAVVKADSRSPAERDAPLETAETSAVGRALAFAGYHGSPEGLAGAEEIELARRRAEARATAQPQQTTRRPDGSSGVTQLPPGARVEVQGDRLSAPLGAGGPTPAQVRYLGNLWGQAGRPGTPPDAERMTRADVSRLIDELRNEAGLPPTAETGRRVGG